MGWEWAGTKEVPLSPARPMQRVRPRTALHLLGDGGEADGGAGVARDGVALVEAVRRRIDDVDVDGVAARLEGRALQG